MNTVTTASTISTDSSGSITISTTLTTVTSISTKTTENAKISIKGNGKIYYTTDGSDPKIFGYEYSNTFVIESSGLSDSAISTESSLISSSSDSGKTTETGSKTGNRDGVF